MAILEQHENKLYHFQIEGKPCAGYVSQYLKEKDLLILCYKPHSLDDSFYYSHTFHATKAIKRELLSGMIIKTVPIRINETYGVLIWEDGNENYRLEPAND